MEIRWNKNPALTNTICDERDRAIIAKALIIEEATDDFFMIEHILKKDDPDKIEKAIERAKKGFSSLFEEEALEKQVDNFVEILATDVHVGDCTCVPCSCLLCYAESLLGFSSIEDFSKHSLYKIDGAFRSGLNTFKEVIDYLEDYPCVMGPKSGWSSQADFDRHVPRWKSEAKTAARQLRAYKEKHFPNED